ncbi:MAG TPA: hypothetical protein VL022_09165 [Moheibacter sp.]|nr:hypothetical protein [Moheibacter sp.]
MLNLRLLANLFTVLILVLLQGMIFSKISFAQLAMPYIYVLFILLYHPNKNRYIFLLLCFLLGWGVDLFEDTGGIHALASITMGYLSKYMVRVVAGTRFFEVEEFHFSDFNVGQWLVYTVVLVFTHHFILFFFENFSFSNLEAVLLRAVYSMVFTLLFVYFYLILFRKKAQR